MNNALGYCRVSTEEQKKEGYSLPMQEKRLRGYCISHDLDIVEVILEEDGVSAYKLLKKRPGGKRFLNLLDSEQIQHVVIWKLDRLFRNLGDAYNRSAEWRQQGIILHFVDLGGQSLNTSSATGKLFFNFMAAIAEFERDLISERTKAVLQYKKESGKKYARVPFGFEAVEVGEEKILVENEQEQRIKQQIHAWREEKLSFWKIADRLNKRGIPTKQGGKRWYASSVRCVCN